VAAPGWVTAIDKKGARALALQVSGKAGPRRVPCLERGSSLAAVVPFTQRIVHRGGPFGVCFAFCAFNGKHFHSLHITASLLKNKWQPGWLHIPSSFVSKVRVSFPPVSSDDVIIIAVKTTRYTHTAFCAEPKAT